MITPATHRYRPTKRCYNFGQCTIHRNNNLGTDPYFMPSEIR
jgi:hypothetical protein